MPKPIQIAIAGSQAMVLLDDGRIFTEDHCGLAGRWEEVKGPWTEAPVSTWLPIDTCPRDIGKNVLVHCSNEGNTYTAEWDGFRWCHFAIGSQTLLVTPDLWMPLPEVARR